MAFTSMIISEDHVAMLHITNSALCRGRLALGCTPTSLRDRAVVGHVTNLATSKAGGRIAAGFRSPFWIGLFSLAPVRVLHQSGAPLALFFLGLAFALATARGH